MIFKSVVALTSFYKETVSVTDMMVELLLFRHRQFSDEDLPTDRAEIL